MRAKDLYFKGAMDILRVLCPGRFQEVVSRVNDSLWGAPGSRLLWLLGDVSDAFKVRGGWTSATSVGHCLSHWGHLSQLPRPLCHQTQLLTWVAPRQSWTLMLSVCCLISKQLFTYVATIFFFFWSASEPVNPSLSSWSWLLALFPSQPQLSPYS